jgi:hypothetical protein
MINIDTKLIQVQHPGSSNYYRCSLKGYDSYILIRKYNANIETLKKYFENVVDRTSKGNLPNWRLYDFKE